MGFRIQVEDGDDLVRVMVDGVFTPQLAKQVFESMLHHPGYRPGMTSIWDMRRVRVEPSHGGQAAYASRSRLRRMRCGEAYRVAIIANTHDRRATASIEEILTTPQAVDCQVFARYEDADHWLCEVNR